ncbi:MAG: hypothetical protein EPO01_07605 [Aquabacterium sp.]|jgi:hypothetical protein|nr:MAG: hypothetical protein EPO12_11900 [Aquabacterium sp.]TAL23245.1 MAG: hypothetical protein EPO01_07605 [Aquabacterium sp.]
MKAHSTRHARTKAHPAEALALADDEADLAGLAGLSVEETLEEDLHDSPIKGLAVRELEFSAFFPQ